MVGRILISKEDIFEMVKQKIESKGLTVEEVKEDIEWNPDQAYFHGIVVKIDLGS